MLITMKITTLICLLSISVSFGQNRLKTSNSFIENRGQIVNQFGNPNEDVVFIHPDSKGMNTQLRKKGFSYDLYSTDKNRKLTINRLDVQFQACNSNVKIIPSIKSTAKFNYFKSGKKTIAISGVNSYEVISYENIYDNIDIVFKSDEATGSIKYDIVLHPGSDINDVQFLYKGFNTFKLTEQNQLQFQLTIRTLNESIPYSFYRENKSEESVVFEVLSASENEVLVGFKLENEQERGKTLVIDPVPNYVWGKYIGDSLTTSTNGVITDRFSYVYICGSTQSLTNIATSGAYQTIINDSINDAYVSKYHKSGTLIWSTYFGGEANDRGNDVYVDTSFNVVITGTTFSPMGITDSLGYQDTLGGDSDAFLARFNENGALIWATYFGGDSSDIGTRLSVDFYENIYLCGTTNSSNNIANDSSFQSVLSGNEDGFLAKFNSSGTLQWSSYLGGSATDFATGIAYGDTSIFITGQTFSTDFPLAGNTQNDTLSGESDGFITKVDNNGQLVWSTYFGGEGGDNIQNVKVFNSNVFIIGTTNSYTNITNIASLLAPQYTKRDTLDAFIAKVDRNDSLIWSTYFGGDSLDYGVDLFFELDSSIIAVGTTNSSDLIGVDSNSYQMTLNGGSDAFLTKLSPDGNFYWSSYYGGTENEQANAVAVYGNTAIYIVGNTFSDSLLIDTSQVNLINTYNSTQEGFFTKFNQARSTASSGVSFGGGYGGSGYGGSSTTGTPSSVFYYCPGDVVLLSTLGGDLGTDAEWFWYEGSCGGTNIIGTGDSIYVTLTTSTTFYVRAESVTNATECSQASFLVAPLASLQITSSEISCEGEDYNLSDNGVGAIEWTGPNSFSMQQFDSTLVAITDSSSGWYSVVAIDTFGCAYEDSFNLSVVAPPVVSSVSTDVSCFGYNNGEVIVTGNNLDDYSFLWIDASTGDSIVATDSLINLSGGSYELTVIDSNACTFLDTFLIQEPLGVLIDTLIIPSSCNDSTGAIFLFIDTSVVNYSIAWDSLTYQSDSALYLGYGLQNVSITLENGCVEDYSFFVDFENTLSVTIDSVQNSYCAGTGTGSATGFPTGGLPPYSFEWSPVNQYSATATSLDTGLVILTIQDSAGCLAYDSVIIEANYAIIVTEEVISATCSDSLGSISLVIENPSSTYVISFSNGETGTLSIDSLTPGQYSVKITDTLGCQYQMNYTIDLINDLEVTVSPDDTLILAGTSIQLTSTVNSSGYLTYQWTPPNDFDCDTCSNPMVTPDETTTYQLLVTNSNGCIDSILVIVNVDDRCVEVYIPTIFSPNNDQLNDRWHIVGDCIDSFHSRVYNQWGETLFESNDQSIGWDGSYQGARVQNDQYAYSVQVTYSNGTSEQFSGIVTVVD